MIPRQVVYGRRVWAHLRVRRGRRAAGVSVEGLLTPAPCFLHGTDEHRRARGGPGEDTRHSHAGRCQEAPLPSSPTRAAYAEVGGVLFVLLYTVRNLVFRFYFRLKKNTLFKLQ